MRNTLLFVLIFVFSCQQKKDDIAQEKDNKDVEKKVTKSFKNFDERVRSMLMEKLSIPADEKFTYEINFEHLNTDDKKDAVILINRLEFAMNVASKSKNPAKNAELGYLGSYNHFVYYDGMKDDFSYPIVIPSSAKGKLKVYFEHLQSENYKDIIIEYRIRNSAFRNYYSLENLNLQLVFQWKKFDQIGEKIYESNYFSYDEGTFCLVKDIVIYKGLIKNYSTIISDIYSYEPEILPTKIVEYRFMFDPNKGKYVTNAKPKDEL
jgi:hypothetical protein